MYDKPFEKEIRIQLKRIENNLSLMIVVDGQLGHGKTTFAVQIADVIEGKLIKFKEQLATGGVDFMSKLQSCYALGKKVIIYDEAGDFNTRGAITKFNGELNKVFETFRAYQMVVIIVLPHFADLDKGVYRKGLPRLLVHIFGRMKAFGCFKAWALIDQLYLRNHLKNPRTIEQLVYNKARPFYTGNFKDLTPARSKELAEFSIGAKQDLLNMYTTKAETAQLLNLSYTTIKKLIIVLGIEPHHSDGKTSFYLVSDMRKVREAYEAKKKGELYNSTEEN